MAMPYGIPNVHVECALVDTGVPVGFWRSVNNSYNGFAVETFIDELAHLARQDPCEYRRSLLAAAPRHLAVLNLAAGLDARPWRLPLPAGLRWVDVDHPVMIDAKLEVLAGETPRCRYEGVRLDLADTAARRGLFARVGAEATRALVITEGLLVYLPAPAVAELLPCSTTPTCRSTAERSIASASSVVPLLSKRNSSSGRLTPATRTPPRALTASTANRMLR